MSVLSRLVRFLILPKPLRVAEDLPPRGDPAWAAFEQEVDDQSRQLLRTILLSVALSALVFWPTDLFILPDDPALRRDFVIWRTGAVVCCGTPYVLLARGPLVHLRATRLAFPFVMAAIALMATMLGRRNGLDAPWFHGMLFFVMLPPAAPETIGVRTGYAAGMCLAIAGGFLGANPQNLDSPWLGPSLVNMLVIGAASIAFGHRVRVGAAITFFQRSRIAAQRAELEALNAELDARVQAQTADLRALSEHLQAVREDERAHLARELHDDLGQRLGATRYALADAHRSVVRGEAGAADQLEEVSRLLGEAAETTHAIVGGLRPPLLDQLGLHGACAWLTQQIASRANLAWDYVPAGDDRDLDEAIGLAIYRVLQEAATNVARHARASRLEVATQVSAEAVSLTVTDDGVGLGPPTPRPPGRGGVGLVGIRERARALGGELDLGVGLEGGVRLTVRLPRPCPEVVA